MKKLLIGLLIIKIVFGVKCYYSALDNDYVLDTMVCSNEKYPCKAKTVIYRSEPNVIVRERHCYKFPEDVEYIPTERQDCQDYCTTDLCNLYDDMKPKPMEYYRSNIEISSTSVSLHPSNNVLLLLLTISALKHHLINP